MKEKSSGKEERWQREAISEKMSFSRFCLDGAKFLELQDQGMAIASCGADTRYTYNETNVLYLSAAKPCRAFCDVFVESNTGKPSACALGLI